MVIPTCSVSVSIIVCRYFLKWRINVFLKLKRLQQPPLTLWLWRLTLSPGKVVPPIFFHENDRKGCKGRLQNPTAGWPAVPSGTGRLSLFRTIETGRNRTEPPVNRRLGFEAVPKRDYLYALGNFLQRFRATGEKTVRGVATTPPPLVRRGLIILTRCKIFRRTQSAQRTRKTHKSYELGEAWRNKCVFKWALNCKKLVMLRRLLGSEFQTVGAAKWNERSPADLRLTRGILSNFSEDEQKTRGGW